MALRLRDFRCAEVAISSAIFSTRGSDERKGLRYLRMAVALNDLGSDWARVSPRRLQMRSSIFRAKVPKHCDAPEILPTAICEAASRKRAILRWSPQTNCDLQTKSDGSAWMP